MSKARSIGRNSTAVSIPKGSSKNLLPYAHEQEKVETLVIDIEALRAISRILRLIKERIDTEDGADRGNCTAGDQCATATGANCSQNNHSEKGEKR